MLSRRQIAQVFRPVGPKVVATGLAANSGTNGGGSTTIAGGTIDLSLPIRGFRLVYKGRIAVGTAAFTSNNPEGILNGISNIKISGTNKRQGGNVTLYDLDLATLFNAQHLFKRRAGAYLINNAEQAAPSSPIAAAWNPFNATGNFDFVIVIDIPFHPFGANGGIQPGFLVRNQEWKDSLQMVVTYGSQAGNAAGAFGTAAATTTVAYTANGSGAGTPSLDVYSLPVIMGEARDLVVPGFITRVQQPLSTVLVNGGANQNLLTLQKQNTQKVIVKVGTSTVNPAFATLSDAQLTQIGVTLGGNRQVRNKVDLFSHKQTVSEHYKTDFITGYSCVDFAESGNPRSGYPGDLVGEGSTFQLTGDATATANAYGIVLQEQMLFAPEGQLYSI